MDYRKDFLADCFEEYRKDIYASQIKFIFNSMLFLAYQGKCKGVPNLESYILTNLEQLNNIPHIKIMVIYNENLLDAITSDIDSAGEIIQFQIFHRVMHLFRIDFRNGYRYNKNMIDNYIVVC